ncbi:hypothetical protein [Spiroplasma endosymbiont of Crioceris asparagi]|uniref:hypothetical protein n=1 Tax=Spiroplasma endosymbiont of Crioceris asparagi TaxID=3066286 RepID=UPI0030CD0CD1
MSQQTRMERFKELHNEIAKKNEQHRLNEEQKNAIYNINETLIAVDKNYFNPKVSAFIKNYDIERPYLDKDKSSNLISEEIKYELRRYFKELINFEKNNQNENLFIEEESTNNLNIDDEKFENFYKNILNTEKVFQERINSILISQRVVATTDLEPNKIEAMRQNDERTINKMIDVTNEANEKIYTKLKQDSKKFASKKINILIITIGVILIVMMLLFMIMFLK